MQQMCLGSDSAKSSNSNTPPPGNKKSSHDWVLKALKVPIVYDISLFWIKNPILEYKRQLVNLNCCSF